MPQLLETRMFRLNWGNAHSSEQRSKTGESGIVEANSDRMDESLARILAEISDGGWEIKASLPLGPPSSRRRSSSRKGPRQAMSRALPPPSRMVSCSLPAPPRPQ